MKYRIDSFGADVVISKKIVNLLTGEYIDMYAPFDYFPTEEEFKEYLDMLNEHWETRSRIPDTYKKAFNE